MNILKVRKARQRDKIHPPLTDYSAAVARAIAWLGDRYLCAQPVKAVRSRPMYYSLYTRDRV
jgi:hypothetical protein